MKKRLCHQGDSRGYRETKRHFIEPKYFTARSGSGQVGRFYVLIKLGMFDALLKMYLN